MTHERISLNSKMLAYSAMDAQMERWLLVRLQQYMPKMQGASPRL